MTVPEVVVIPDARLLRDFDFDHASYDSACLRDVRLSLTRVLLRSGKSETTESVTFIHQDVTPELVRYLQNVPSRCSPTASLYRIATAGRRGLGTFASSPVGPGECIFSETPLLIYPQAVPFHRDQPSGKEYTELEDAISSMSPGNRKNFYALMNSHPLEPSTIKGIIDTNALHLGVLPGSTLRYAAVCRDISRVNHSCSPNAVTRFDLHTFSFELRALFPIAAGEEICISYIDPALPLSSRQLAISSYGFTCTCEFCSLSGPALAQSEARRALIARADDDLDSRNAALERWARTPSMPDDYINRVDRMYMGLFATERLYYEPVWEGFAVRLCKACCAARDTEGARRWAALAAALNRAYTGEDRGWAAVEAAPDRTEWWGLRRCAHVVDRL